MGLGSGIRDPRSGIQDPEKTYSGSRIPDPGVKKAPDPGSGSATLINSEMFSPILIGSFSPVTAPRLEEVPTNPDFADSQPKTQIWTNK